MPSRRAGGGCGPAGLICLGAGAGLTGADLRGVRGSDIACRSGGVLVEVRGRRPRVVPVLSRYHDLLLASAAFAGTRLVTGGRDPGRRNVTTPLIPRSPGGPACPGWTPGGCGRPGCRLRRAPRAGHFMAAAGITCSQRLGDLIATLDPGARHGRWPCSAARGERAGPAGPAGDIIDGPGSPAGSSNAARRGPAPPAAGPHPADRLLLTLADHRPAHLTRVHQALTGLPETDRIRLGVVADWKHGPHLLTYRQVERTFHLVVAALAKDHPDGAPSPDLAAILDALLEASIPPEHKNTTRAWPSTGATWKLSPARRPRAAGTAPTPKPPGDTAAATAPARKTSSSTATTCQPAPWSQRKTARPSPSWPAASPSPPAASTPPGPWSRSWSACSPAASRLATSWTTPGTPTGSPRTGPLPLRAAGAQLIQDLHPDDRGPRGTHAGAIISNGNLYCPATPRPLLGLGPLARDASAEQTTAHDQQTAELPATSSARSPPTTQTATTGSCAPPPWASSAARYAGRWPWATSGPRSSPRPSTPRLLHPADHHRPPRGARQDRAETRLPLQGPPPLLRAALRCRADFSTAKDPASNDISRGWCRLMGLTPIALFAACLLIVRNQRILTPTTPARTNAQHAATCPQTRRRHHKTLASLAGRATITGAVPTRIRQPSGPR